jgi:Pyruvate decarboxylase and related thiamine pyrophosphate-requiring enzymes
MDQSTYVRMSAPVNRAQAVLTDEATMGLEVDKAIEEAIKTKLPVTIYVPTDMVPLYLDECLLETPLQSEITNRDKVIEERLVRAVLEAIQMASSPSILADVLSIRHGAQDLTRKLVSLTQFPSFSTPLAKGVIDETTTCYHGVYNGKGNVPCNQADLCTYS